MTGNDVCNRALVELARDGSTVLENGLTLLQELQDALNRIIDDMVIRWPFEFLIPPAPDVISMVVSQSVYDLADNSVEVVDIVMDTGAIDTRKLDGIPLRRFRSKWAAIQYLPRGKPIEWVQINRTQFQVGPAPDAAYTLRINATKRPQPIVNYGLEITVVPGEFHDALVFGTAMRGAGKVQDFTRLPIIATQYESWIKKMIEDDKRRPDMEFVQQPFRAAPPVYDLSYWASPFIRNV